MLGNLFMQNQLQSRKHGIQIRAGNILTPVKLDMHESAGAQSLLLVFLILHCFYISQTPLHW